MVKMETVTLDQKEEICDFLNMHFPKQQERCSWSALLDHGWAKDEPYGYALFDEDNNDKIVGFIATIFANRIIDGKEVTTCSLSTWAVGEGSRGKGLSMVSKLVKRKNILFLDFSANDASRKIFEFYKFKQLEKEEWTFLASPILKREKPIYKFGDDIPLESLHESDRRFLKDSKTKCVNHVFIDFGQNGGLLVIFKKKNQKKMNFLEILYLSSYDMKQSDMIKVLKSLALNQFTFGVVIDSRLIGETRLFYFKKPIQYSIYRNNLENEVEISSIDLLYSEKILLC